MTRTLLGLPDAAAGPLGYVAARCAPLVGAGPDAVVAAFGSISPGFIRAAFQILGSPERLRAAWDARDEVVVEGLRRYAPALIDPLAEYGAELWSVVEQLPLIGVPIRRSIGSAVPRTR